MTLDETPRSSQAIRDRNRAIRTDGRTSSLRLLLLDAPIYYALLTVLNAIMPANPREIYMTWSRLEWRFWLLMNLTGWGAMWLLALSHASMCGAMGVVMGVKMKVGGAPLSLMLYVTG